MSSGRLSSESPAAWCRWWPSAWSQRCLHGNLLIAALILLAMTFAAAVTASRRAPEIKNPLLVSFYAIAAGSSVVIAVLLATKTLTTDLVVLGAGG